MSIDWWTIGLQAINVLILVWLLGRYFWRPVADIIAKRQAAAKELLESARTRRDQADATLAEVVQLRATMAQQRADLLAKAQGEIEQMRAQHLLLAAQQAQAVLGAAQVELARRQAAAEHIWREHAAQLAVSIAQRLAARLDSAAVREAFLGWLLHDLRVLPEVTLQALARTGNADVISAMPLDAVEQAHHAEQIGAALGTPMALTFSTDPALIAGLELHSAHLVVNNSWRADLARILEDLGDVEHA